jgi:hypothetical protein
MKKCFIAAAVLFCTAAVAFGGPRKASPRRAVSAPLAYRPAGTVAFASLDTIAKAVAGIAGAGSRDLVLTYTVPAAIRRQGVAILFGPMRPGAHGVAVCYVEPSIAARVAASKRPAESDLDRIKRWTVVYPASVSRAAFLRRNPLAVPDARDTLRLPPGRHSRRTLWAWFSPDGQWAVLGPSPAMAANAYSFSAKARARPLGRDLAYLQMDASGARALFGAGVVAGGTMAVRMGVNGLELRGSGRMGTRMRSPLPRGAFAFAGVPVNSPLFGVTTTPSDVRVAEDVFAMAGPEFSAYVKASLRYISRPASSDYFLNVADAPAAGVPPAQRLARILPEAKSLPSTANVMFCSPTTVMRHCLPRVAAKMMPFDSAKLQVVLRLLRRVRGDGIGVMGWREGSQDKFFVRISRDELWGTANLWSAVLLD